MTDVLSPLMVSLYVSFVICFGLCLGLFTGCVYRKQILKTFLGMLDQHVAQNH